jgi:hypothetical protein
MAATAAAAGSLIRAAASETENAPGAYGLPAFFGSGLASSETVLYAVRMTNTETTTRLSTRLVICTRPDGSYFVGRLTGDSDAWENEVTEYLDNVVHFNARDHRVNGPSEYGVDAADLSGLDLDSLEADAYYHALADEQQSIEQMRYELDQQEAHLSKALADFI